jgi:hypothetical protein
MKSIGYYLALTLLIMFSFTNRALAFSPTNLSNKSSGKIFLDVDNKGEAWYVNTTDFHRYYLGRPLDAFNLMRSLSLGFSNKDFDSMSSNMPAKFKGKIILKVEDSGKAYYVNPATNALIFLGKPADAFNLMRKYSLGIKNSDLKTIPIGKLILDASGREVNREWQYQGFWAKVNVKKLTVVLNAGDYSTASGTLFLGNTVKILKMVKFANRTWYQLDGGQHFGAYIDSQFVTPMAQPLIPSSITIPSVVKKDDYWVDVDLTKKVLALYKNNLVVMATYISTGNIKTPTIIGSYNVWYKIKTTRMQGAPPIATHVYDLQNVPWVMYYKGSYSLHGTYWHDDFGTQRSAGCTNMTIGDAKFIFEKTKPYIGNSSLFFSTTENPGMVVRNHY